MQNTVETTDVRTKLEKYQASKDFKLKNTMSVPEMRRLLGVKKTESYWLVHRNFFETKVIDGMMRVDIESFEKWYANQVKHKKVTGEKPGAELLKTSYSFKEAANLLGVHDSSIYEVWRKEQLNTITVDFVMRIPKETFDKWYVNQTKYQKVEKVLSIEELETYYIPFHKAAALLKIPRSKLLIISKSKEYREILEVRICDNTRYISQKSFQRFLNVQNDYKVRTSKTKQAEDDCIPVETKDYISRQEAADIAGVTTATITKWVQMEKFSAVGAGRVLRIYRKEFLKWTKKYREGGL